LVEIGHELNFSRQGSVGSPPGGLLRPEPARPSPDALGGARDLYTFFTPGPLARLMFPSHGFPPRGSPELTRSDDIQLNERVLLRRRAENIRSHSRRIPPGRWQSPQVSYSAWRLCLISPQCHTMIADSHDIDQSCSLQSAPAWVEAWHVWTFIIPRRSITGRLVYGRIWRRRDRRHWIHKKLVEYDE
jgi:hypothetical protein